MYTAFGFDDWLEFPLRQRKGRKDTIRFESNEKNRVCKIYTILIYILEENNMKKKEKGKTEKYFTFARTHDRKFYSSFMYFTPFCLLPI